MLRLQRKLNKRLPVDFMAICMIPIFTIFIFKFLYFQVLHNFHIFTLNRHSQLFQLSIFAAALKTFRNTACRLENAEGP